MFNKLIASVLPPPIKSDLRAGGIRSVDDLWNVYAKWQLSACKAQLPNIFKLGKNNFIDPSCCPDVDSILV